MLKQKAVDGRKIWLVAHPISQFKEDVKQLAKEKGLRIVDARFRSSYPIDRVEAQPPSLTPKGKRQLAKEAKEVAESFAPSEASDTAKPA